MKKLHLFSILSLFVAVITILSRPVVAANIDIMMVVDNSGDYGSEFLAIADNLQAAINASFDVDDDVQLGLVTFNDSATFDQDIGSLFGVLNALSNTTVTGSLEVGAQAVSLATTATFRPGSFRHVIVFTDAPGDITPLELSQAVTDLTSISATLWVDFSDEFGDTSNYESMLNMSGSLDGSGQPLLYYSNLLNADLVLQEIFTDINTSSTVPIPAAVWLFGSGLLGLIGISRRKKAA